METKDPISIEKEDSTAAILSYITLIGFLIAIVMQSSNKTKLGSYHLKQALGILTIGFISGFVLGIIGIIPFVGLIVFLIGPIVWISLLVLAIMGVLNASNGQCKPVPVVGTYFEKLFASVFN